MASSADAQSDAARTDADPLCGEVVRLRVDESGKAVSLYGAVRRSSGQPTSFYMRGREVRGIVEVGDSVRVEGITSTEADGLRVTHLDNLTTQSRVSVWEPPFYRRLGGWLGPFLLSAIVGPILGGLVAAVLGVRGAGASHGGSESTGPSPAIVVLAFVTVTLLVAIAVFYRLYTRPRRKRRAALVVAVKSHIALNE